MSLGKAIDDNETTDSSTIRPIFRGQSPGQIYGTARNTTERKIQAKWLEIVAPKKDKRFTDGRKNESGTITWQRSSPTERAASSTLVPVSFSDRSNFVRWRSDGFIDGKSYLALSQVRSRELEIFSPRFSFLFFSLFWTTFRRNCLVSRWRDKRKERGSTFRRVRGRWWCMVMTAAAHTMGNVDDGSYRWERKRTIM